MTANDYLKKILEQQTFDNDDQELKDLRQRRKDIDKKLRSKFSEASPSITWAGSMAKGTMIRESYDGDMTFYVPHDDENAGKTLKDIYDNVAAALEEDYSVERKASALRIRDESDWSNDLHIDVVPGRYTSDDKTDVFLHRTTADKKRLKTNLQTHVDHVKGSKVVDAIRLIKLWKVRNSLYSAKTFVLELLVVKLLDEKKSLDLPTQLEHVWSRMRDDADNLSVEDPANSNNELKGILDECRSLLSSAAGTALFQVDNSGWEAVFGELEDDEKGDDESSSSNAIDAAVKSVTVPSKPYRREE